MREDRGPGRVQADREVVGEQGVDALGDAGDLVAVGDDLVIGDEDEGVDPLILQRDPVAQAAEVVAQVQVTGGPVAGEHPVALGVHLDVGLDLRTAGQAALQGCVGGGIGERVAGPRVVQGVGRGDVTGHAEQDYVTRAGNPLAVQQGCGTDDTEQGQRGLPLLQSDTTVTCATRG